MTGLQPSFINTAAKYLAGIEPEKMQVEFVGCIGWKDGTFKLDEIDLAGSMKTSLRPTNLVDHYVAEEKHVIPPIGCT